MKLMHASGFSGPEREAFRAFVFSNMVGAMQSILQAMEDHNVTLNNRDNEVSHRHASHPLVLGPMVLLNDATF